MTKYYLLDYKTHQYGSYKYAFESFKEIKDFAIDKLDCSGWEDKSTVDLRSLRSCINYICDDFSTYKLTESTSNNKFWEYKNSKHAGLYL